jgi:hypothetical protein
LKVSLLYADLEFFKGIPRSVRENNVAFLFSSFLMNLRTSLEQDHAM